MDGAMRDYGIPDAAMQSGEEGRCFVSEHAAIWQMWSATHAAELDRKSMLTECAIANDVSLETSSGHPPTAAELEQLLLAAGVNPAECG
jgi:hypothetical protein